MNGWKNRLKFIGRKASKIKTWQLVITLIILVILSVVFLRTNNVRMIELRDEVIAADASGDGEVLQAAATRLQNHVSRHMNTDTGQIALQTSYNTAVRRAFAEANNDIDASGYAVAAEQCKTVLYASGYQSYAACVANAVGISESKFKTPELPNPAMFYLSYAAPVISFDLAGVAMVLATVVFFVIILKLLTEVTLYFISRKQ